MRLKNVDVGEGSLSPEQITEFIDQMQVYEGAMYGDQHQIGDS